MKETVFYLEGRRGMYLFHFFVYNLGGIYYILNREYNNRPYNDSVLLEDRRKVVPEPTTEISFPIKIYMQNILPFQREAFEIIQDKFELIEDLSTIEDYEIVSIYGVMPGIENIDHPLSFIIYPFIRQLFLEKCHHEMIKGKRIFITRKNSESQHNGNMIRFILNEEELKGMLKKYHFEFIQLEDYSVPDKIKLFAESEIILSSNSGSLTLTLFSNENTKVIEILNRGTYGFQHNHYISITKAIGLNYNRYSNIVEDSNGNFNLNTEDFEKYLLSIL